MAATRLEAWAVRRAVAHGTPVARCGVGATRSFPAAASLVICGLAGSLTDELAPGRVVVPASVGLPSGELFACDPVLQSAFLRAAKELGYEPSVDSLVTLPTVATGPARVSWRERGFAAVDMESALAASAGRRLAVVRVVLDAPRREIGREWISPLTVLARPRLWPQALSLAWNAPWYSLRAAQVVSRGLALLAA